MTLPAFAADHGRLHQYQSIVGICCLQDTQQQNIHVTAAVDRRDRQTDAHLRPSSAYYAGSVHNNNPSNGPFPVQPKCASSRKTAYKWQKCTYNWKIGQDFSRDMSGLTVT